MMGAPDSWLSKSVADCIEPIRGIATDKVQARDYKPTGLYPIVDQGQAPISGWTDDASAVIDKPLPLIVFGDHTRTFKYVDFPFVRGADGTQLLKPKAGIEPLFFFYACRAIELEGRGYNRHFSMLKERLISYPQDSLEQLAIGEVLRGTERALSQQGLLLAKANALKQAAMHELFTRGLRGEAQKKTEIGIVPASWAGLAISQLGPVVTGTTPPTRDPTSYDGGGVPFISPGDIEHGFAIAATAKFITASGLAVSRPLPMGTTCVVCIGSTIGKVGRTTAAVSATNQQINAVIPSAGYVASYLTHLLTFWSDQVRNAASPSPVPILSKGVFERIKIYTSLGLSEQQEIAAILDAIDRKIDLHQRKRAVLEELFKSLLHKLMTGEIAVADLDLSAFDMPKEPA